MKTWKQFNENITNKDYRKLKKRFDEVDFNNYDDDEDDNDYREFIISINPSIIIGVDEGYDYNIVFKINDEILYEKDLDDLDLDDFLIKVENILYDNSEYFELYKKAVKKKYFNINLNNIVKYNKKQKAKKFNL